MLDVQKPVPGLIVHTVKVNIGTVAVDARAETHVDADYRRGATQAHSGTHIVHAALREVKPGRKVACHWAESIAAGRIEPDADAVVPPKEP